MVRFTASAPPLASPLVPYSSSSVWRSSRVSVLSSARTSGSDTEVLVRVTGTVDPSFSSGADGVPGWRSTK